MILSFKLQKSAEIKQNRNSFEGQKIVRNCRMTACKDEWPLYLIFQWKYRINQYFLLQFIPNFDPDSFYITSKPK
jgi:hypothetical protein